MTDSQGFRSRWKTVVTEFVTIVVGILVALAADAWWQDRADRREEQEVIGSLVTEFTASGIELQERLGRHQQIAQSLDRILDWIAPLPDLPDDETIAQELWQGIGVWVTYDDRRGVLDGLIASGRLSLIQNDSLRAMLAGWPAEVEDLAEEEVAAARDLDERVKPRWYQLSPPPEGSFPPTYEDLFSDPVFEHLILERLTKTEEVFQEYSDVLHQLDQILTVLGAELAR